MLALGFEDFVIYAPFTGSYFLPFICSVQTKKGTDTVSVPPFVISRQYGLP